MKRFFKIIFYIIYILFVAAAAYGGYIAYRAQKLYDIVKTPNKGWEGQLHQADPVLGYKPIPKTGGYERAPDGEKIPMWYNEQGFREPVKRKVNEENKKPLLLFLGCSFTFGSACSAENTFPFIVGEKMNGKVLNAGVCSYGFAHTVLRARELIPKYKPDFVFVQWSPWHVQRAINMYRPTPYWSLPMPYIAMVDGKNKIIPPPFTTNIFKMPIMKFKDTGKSRKDFFMFFKEVAVPLYVHEDYSRILTKVKLFFGRIPGPNITTKDIERDVFNELYNICKQNGSTMVVVFLGNRKGDHNRMPAKNDLVFVDAESALWDQLEEKTQRNYDLTYKHVAGDPPAVFDQHPNNKAHGIIAEAIYKRMVQHVREVRRWIAEAKKEKEKVGK